ncbi:MAG: hypothetical protein ACT4QF_05630 [Sporichthyaceae bacterium]
MNPILKRGLAISAIAPLAFIASVGSAAAASTNWVEGNANRVGDSRLVTVGVGNDDCEHPLNPALQINVFALTSGGVFTDRDDIEEVTVFVSDEDMENEGGPDEVQLDVPNVEADKVKIAFYSDNFVAEARDLRDLRAKERETKRVKQGRAKFDNNVDDVQWIAVTAEWDEVPLAEDDTEELTCYFELNP